VKEDRCNNTGHPALHVRFSESFTYVVIATRVRVGATRYYISFGILEFWSSVHSVVEWVLVLRYLSILKQADSVFKFRG
jgi:hypothetical protein